MVCIERPRGVQDEAVSLVERNVHREQLQSVNHWREMKHSSCMCARVKKVLQFSPGPGFQV